MLIQGISAFFAAAAFSVLFYLPKKYIIPSGLTGSFCWFIYLVVQELTDDQILATFVATLLVAIASHILARVYKTPVTMFLIPGVICLVPGAGMYQIVISILDNTIEKTTYYFFQTMQMAGAIALGIFIVDTIFRGTSKSKK